MTESREAQVPERDASDAANSGASVWNLPNAISLARIGLIGVFGWQLAIENDLWAIIALALAGVSDFLDGYLARKWNQVTALGRFLDPTADRLLTVVVVIGLAVRGVIPWWLVAILLVRDVAVGVALLFGRARGTKAPHVSFIGKLATAGLYLMMPLAFLAYERWDAVYIVGLVGTTLAAILYWYAGIGYIRDITARTYHPARGESARHAPE